MFEGVPNYPDFSRFWQVVDKHQVEIFYAAPTALRALMREGDEPVTRTSRQSLRLLGSVGEPINPEAWEWYYRVVGDGRCPIVDTWWQTETGGHMITPAARRDRPQARQRDQAVLRRAAGSSSMPKRQAAARARCSGALCITDSWPGQMRTVYGDDERFFQTYFSHYPGKYFTGDGCRRDEDGYYWITGRIDDVINVSGHRHGHRRDRERAGAARACRRGRGRRLPARHQGPGHLRLRHHHRRHRGQRRPAPRAGRNGCARRSARSPPPTSSSSPPRLPKTRTGKIMRRILRKIAENDVGNLGDTSTLADPSVVEDLVAGRP